MRRAFFFDVDGVIANSEGAKGDSWAKTFEKYDVRKDGARVDGKAWYIERVGTHGQVLCREAIETFGISGIGVDDLFDDQVACSKPLEAQAEIIDHNIAFIRALYERGGVLLAAVSSNYTDVIRGHLGRAGVVELFDAITSGVDELPHERQKPHKDICLLTAGKLDVVPAECIGIEDTTPGVRAYNAADMYSIGYINPDSGSQDLSMADLRVSDLSMLDAQKVLAA